MVTLLKQHALTSASVTLVGAMQTDFETIDDLLAFDGETWAHPRNASDARGGDWLAEFGGRLCYRSFGARASGRSHTEYITNLLAQGHGSVFEHAVFSFALFGVSRTLTHELLRHRVGVAVSQVSQRYVNDPALLRFVVPPALHSETWEGYAMQTWRRMVEQATESYIALLATLERQMAYEHPTWTPHTRRKAASEAARAVLPGCTETRLLWTVNARTLRHVLALRGAPGVDAEFRAFAVKLAQETLANSDTAALFPDLSVDLAPDGLLAVRLAYGRV